MTTERSIEEQAPSTVKEVGIHLAYMKEDIKEVKNFLVEMSKNYVTINEHNALRDRVRAIEGYIKWLVYIVGGAVITTILKVAGVM